MQRFQRGCDDTTIATQVKVVKRVINPARMDSDVEAFSHSNPTDDSFAALQAKPAVQAKPVALQAKPALQEATSQTSTARGYKPNQRCKPNRWLCKPNQRCEPNQPCKPNQHCKPSQPSAASQPIRFLSPYSQPKVIRKEETRQEKWPTYILVSTIPLSPHNP